MKTKTYSLILLLTLAPILGFTQDTLAGWTFPTGQPADTVADFFSTNNAGRAVKPAGGVSGQLTFTNGPATYAATATGWDNGMNTKCWVTSLSTAAYHNLFVSSKQRSGGNNPGPRDFRLEYKTGESGTWTEVNGSNVVVLNDWSGELNHIALPESCENLTELLYLRWVMTSNTNSLGDPVLNNGISKIDEIFITGDILTDVPSVAAFSQLLIYPNPAIEYLVIQSASDIQSIRILDITGKNVHFAKAESKEIKVDLTDFPAGLYMIEIQGKGNIFTRQKIVKAGY
ncbi:MAG: T9SS type A sorting domain-containing protein [Bacteroidales bacterium]